MQGHYKKLENMYLLAPIIAQLYEGTTVEISEEQAKISTGVKEKYFHGAGAVHGSVYFRLLDDAAFFAVNSIVTDAFVYTVSFNINITRPVKGGVLTAIGKVKFKSSRLFIAESTLYNDNNEVVGFGTGNFMKSNIPLNENVGYE